MNQFYFLLFWTFTPSKSPLNTSFRPLQVFAQIYYLCVNCEKNSGNVNDNVTCILFEIMLTLKRISMRATLRCRTSACSHYPRCNVYVYFKIVFVNGQIMLFLHQKKKYWLLKSHVRCSVRCCVPNEKKFSSRSVFLVFRVTYFCFYVFFFKGGNESNTYVNVTISNLL